MGEYRIRPYRSSDRSNTRTVCKKTAFEDYLHDEKKNESVPIMFHDYFVDYEPEYSFVIADRNDEAVGYIICATNYSQFLEKMQGEYTERLLQTAPMEKAYLDHFLANLMKVPAYAVHFHMDMLPECQRMGFGTKLIQALISKLRENGFSYLSAVCVSRAAASYALCKKLGFVEFYDFGNDITAIRKDF